MSKFEEYKKLLEEQNELNNKRMELSKRYYIIDNEITQERNDQLRPLRKKHDEKIKKLDNKRKALIAKLDEELAEEYEKEDTKYKEATENIKPDPEKEAKLAALKKELMELQAKDSFIKKSIQDFKTS